MSEQERRSTPLDLSSVEIRESGKKPKISGYAAVYYDSRNKGTEYTVDGFRERIAPGAFKRAIQENQDVVALFDHDTSKLLGRSGAGTLELESDGRGLKYTIHTADTTIARDVVENIRAGNLQGSSFAFRVKKESWEEGDDGEHIRTVQDVDLFDVGPVTNPAYPATSTEAAGRGAQRLAKAAAKKALDAIEL